MTNERMRRGMLLHRQGGFTLIEVLVVVAIIALLVAILLPSLAEARKKTRRTVCASQLHEIGIALLMYQQTYRNFPPQVMINVNAATGKGQAFGLWSVQTHQTVSRYLKTSFRASANKDKVRSSELFYCPEVTDNDRQGDILGTDQVDGNAEPYVHVTYSYLGRLNEAENDPAKPRAELGESTKSDVPNRRKFYVANEPDSRHALMSDMLMFWGGVIVKQGKPRWRVNHGPYYGPYAEGSRLKFEGSNLAHGDGHVEWKNAAKFPTEVRNSAPDRNLRLTAQLVRDNDFIWW